MQWADCSCAERVASILKTGALLLIESVVKKFTGSTGCTVQSPLWGVTLQFVRCDSDQLAAAGVRAGARGGQSVCRWCCVLVSSSVSR
jgi:hypothetical protein